MYRQHAIPGTYKMPGIKCSFISPNNQSKFRLIKPNFSPTTKLFITNLFITNLRRWFYWLFMPIQRPKIYLIMMSIPRVIKLVIAILQAVLPFILEDSSENSL